MSKKTCFKEIWINKYCENKDNIKKVYDYTVINKDVYEYFNEISISKIIDKGSGSTTKILYYCLLDSINATPQTNLDNICNTTKKFTQILNGYNTQRVIDFKEFIKKFDENNKDINDFFRYIVKNYKGIGNKIASVFIRELNLVNKKQNILENFKYEEFKYKIALDIVIEDLFNQMLKFEHKIDNEGKRINKIINAQRDFINFHEFIEEINMNQEIVESFWFWGYFNTKIKKIGLKDKETDKVKKYTDFRDIGFNEAKFYTNPFFYPWDEENNFVEKLKGFANCFKESIILH